MTQNEAGLAVRNITNEAMLARMTLSHMLWEGQFYVDGQASAEVIRDLVAKVNPTFTMNLAEKARSEYKLRHVPLLLTRELARRGALKADALANVIQRPDEMGEFLSIYWADKKDAPVSNQVKKGLAKAFLKFNEYQLAKWDKNSAGVSIRDVMFLCHPTPSEDKVDLFKRIANQELKTPDTWEVALSGGADKKETFGRLMAENNLGALAFLRNLRNMIQAGVNESDIRMYAKNLNVDKVLPFRYVAAARHAPKLEDMLEEMMLRSLASAPKLPGRTVLLVDVSGSMWHGNVSEKSELSRFDAAAALAMMCREICEEVAVYTFSDRCVQVKPRRGFALADQLSQSQPHSGTRLGAAMDAVNRTEKYDRVIVFTDEQSHDRPDRPANGAKGYILNVASYKNGINSGAFETITGFSEAVLDYIRLGEQL